MRQLLLVVLCSTNVLHAQQWNWAAGAGAGGNVDFCYDIATDSQGNAYWVGSLAGTVDFGCGTITDGSSDVMGFIAKRSPDGTCQWVRAITVGFNDAWAYGVAIDAADRIYVTGSYNGNADFGNGVTLNSLGIDDIFLARYDTVGTCLWARRAGSSASNDEARGVAVSPDGGIFIAGFSGGTTIAFDGISIPNAGNFRQLVIARYDSLGTVQWARASTGNGQGKSCQDISVAGDRVFVTGQVGSTVASYDGIALTPGSAGSYLYVLATDLDGNGVWARSYGNGDNEGMGISADTLGNVFVAARLWGNLFLPDDTLTSASSNDDILVMKLDREGAFHWAQSTGSAQRDLAWDVDADGMGNVLVAAHFQQSIDFFGTPFTALGGEDALIAKLDGDGNVVWASRPSGFQRDIPLCIHRQATAPNSIFFGGYYWGVITYGGSTIDDVGNGDAMLVAGVDTTFAVSAYATPVCPGACDGVAYAVVNGDQPFTYAWSTGATTSSVAGLCAGTYVVEVADAGGHLLVDTVIVTEHGPLDLSIQVDGDSLWVEGGSDWIWELDGFQVGAGQPYHIAWASGTYMVHFQDAYGCMNGSPTIIVVLGVGVEEDALGALRAWPNPMADLLHVQGLSPGMGVELRDALGRLIWQGQAAADRMEIPTHGLPHGSYLLRTESGAAIRLMR
ncbi:MAG: SBBP repeat-containing protein [Flavobacteriales bacterium]|nr:MAG: SBBP repeat-containing protein [Flavobacteriales bacterium]